MKQNKSLIIGLTGGIASGKSTISKLFRRYDIPVIDADIVAREVVEKGTNGLNKIVELFGKEILLENGELNRKKLGELIFNSQEAVEMLNGILHPIIKQQIAEYIAQYAHKNESIIVLDAALLFEAKCDKLVDKVVVVDVSESVQLNRLMTRNSINEDRAAKMIESQTNREYKRKRADYIVQNDGTLNQLEEQVQKLVKQLKKETV